MTEHALVGGDSGGPDGRDTGDDAAFDGYVQPILDRLHGIPREVGVDVRAVVVTADDVAGGVDPAGILVMGTSTTS